jgi:histidine kinase
MLLQKTRKRHSLVLKLIASVGVILLASCALWAILYNRQYKAKVMADVVADCDRLSEAILLGTHDAMMSNSRDDINQIITNIGRLKGLEHVRIYNKKGRIKFSNLQPEVGRQTGIKAEACHICHHSEPPLERLDIQRRKRLIQNGSQPHMLGIISPIYNEPGCSASTCHAHPPDKKILGALDVVISLGESQAQISSFNRWLVILAVILFTGTSAIIFFVLLRFYIGPIRRIIQGTRQIGQGRYAALGNFNTNDEMGQLAGAIHRMGQEIGEKQTELNRQKDDYRRLFDLVPCIITVQDRDYRLLSYNREFSKRFDPAPGEFCYTAYKGRSEKCEFCPVEKTFADGLPHFSEETGLNKDGTRNHWIVKTVPMTDAGGEIVGAMEMSLDITQHKVLEDRLVQSEKKYHAIFNNIPNPVFLLDSDTFEILDCNNSVGTVYGYRRDEVAGRSFLDFFDEDEREGYARQMRRHDDIERVRHRHRSGQIFFVHIRVTPSDDPNSKVLLATTTDITQQLEAELQLIQAGKMATLGEMATGVAHELNQPLSVIKTASNFFIKKTSRAEPIAPDILETMAKEIDQHVDRASGIINHLRQFGRKSDIALEPVAVNSILRRAFEMFGQQLKLRDIEVVWQIDETLPIIQAEGGRLEQVFINLLINARDAIEERWPLETPSSEAVKKITLKSYRRDDQIHVDICDTGKGIPESIRSKIFEPFFTTKKVGEGTGIGLSISYGIINDLRGRIWVTSKEGQGTCFKISLPIGRSHENSD